MYLKAGLALVLVWVGIEMMLTIDVVYVPTTLSLAVVATIIGTSIWLSPPGALTRRARHGRQPRGDR